MTQRAVERYKALILILMALFFAEKFVSGKLYYYIGPRFGWLAIVAAALLILLAGAYNLVGRGRGEDAHEDHGHDDHNHGHDHGGEKASIWPLLIVAFPLILGVVIPARPLGASAISNRGISTDVAVASDSASRLTIVPAERNILDWVREMNANPDPAALDGQQADITGFVYRDPRFADDQFMAGRFTLTCCVADALAIGVVVKADDASQFETDSWVRVTGTFEAGELDGLGIPVLVAGEVTPVQAPEQPYLYP